MGVISDQEHVLGSAAAFFFEPQTVLDTMVRPTAGGAFNLLKWGGGFSQERENRNDNRLSAGVSSRISKMRKVTASGEGYVIPSGSAGTAPDIGELIQCVMGTETVNASTSVVYTLSNSQAIQFGTLARFNYSGASGGVAISSEVKIGAWIDELKLMFNGADPPKFSFSGGARRQVDTARGVLNGAMSSSATMVLSTATRYAVEVDSVVQVASNTNSSTGYRVTADASPSFTLETTQSASDAAVVAPYAPTGTLTGSPIAGIAGSVTVGGNDITAVVVAGEVTISRGLRPIEDGAFALHVPDVITGERTVSGSLTMRLRADQFATLNARKKNGFATVAVTLVLGSTAGSICTIAMPQVELEFSDVDYPEGREEATVQVPFYALESSTTSADAISITFT